MFDAKRLLSIPEQFSSGASSTLEGVDYVEALEAVLVQCRTECDGIAGHLAPATRERIALATVLHAFVTHLMGEVKARTSVCFSGAIPQGFAHIIVDLWGKHLGCEELLKGVVNGITRPLSEGDTTRTHQLNTLTRALESLLLDQAVQLARVSNLSSFSQAIDWATMRVRDLRRTQAREGDEMMSELAAAR